MSEANNSNPTSISLANGRSLAIGEGERALRIADSRGVVELEIELREAGPVVRVRAAALQLETAGELSLDCERFELRAREGIRMVSERDCSASIAGDLDFRAGGHAHWEGRSVRVRAKRGDG